jgi:hypothetical protein
MAVVVCDNAHDIRGTVTGWAVCHVTGNANPFKDYNNFLSNALQKIIHCF